MHSDGEQPLVGGRRPGLIFFRRRRVVVLVARARVVRGGASIDRPSRLLSRLYASPRRSSSRHRASPAHPRTSTVSLEPNHRRPVARFSSVSAHMMPHPDRQTRPMTQKVYGARRATSCYGSFPGFKQQFVLLLHDFRVRPPPSACNWLSSVHLSRPNVFCF